MEDKRVVCLERLEARTIGGDKGQLVVVAVSRHYLWARPMPGISGPGVLLALRGWWQGIRFRVVTRLEGLDGPYWRLSLLAMDTASRQALEDTVRPLAHQDTLRAACRAPHHGTALARQRPGRPLAPMPRLRGRHLSPSEWLAAGFRAPGAPSSHEPRAPSL